MSEPIIDFKNVGVQFDNAGQKIDAVKDASFKVEKGEVFGVVGYSGAGKSSLVRLINLLHQPTSGSISITGVQTVKNGQVLIKGSKLRELRKKVGMIFQHFNLLDQTTVLGNVLFALKHAKLSKNQKLEKARKLIDQVGLTQRLHNYPAQLSGGQKQRVAIARALANDPEILISDEATSALDPKTTQQILDLLSQLNRERGLTIVLITHEMQVVKNIANRVAVMQQGQIIEQNSVYKVFADPQKDLTKEFIETASGNQAALEKILEQQNLDKLKEDQLLVELKFTGNATDQPLISYLSKEFDLTVNILYGNIESIQKAQIGNLIAIFTGKKEGLKAALEAIKEQKVQIKVIKGGQI